MKADKIALIVDDEADMADYLAKVSALAGFHTMIAHTSEELFSIKTQKTYYDVVILDLILPDKDGVELLRELAEEACPSPLILVSGHDDKVLDSARQVAEARGLTVVGVLTKPIRSHDLIALLKTLPESAPYKSSGKLQVDVSTERLRKALEHEELEVFLQPQVSLCDGKWIGMEALVRWQHPEAGLLGADVFVSHMETHGLALDMTLQVATKALRALKNSAEKLAYDGIISINLAPVSLTDLQFPEQMLEVARKEECDPKKIFFEVTETSIPRDPAMAMDILTRLRLKGFQLSIDDFGTGYSTMTSLRNLPISEIKLDLSFIRPALEDITARKIAIQSLALGKELGLQVMAEGLETEAHWHWLNEAGCDAAQGYFIAKPMPEKALEPWYREWKERKEQLNDFNSEQSPLGVDCFSRDVCLLIVDDEAGMRDLLTHYLVKDGYDVQAANSVDHAWHLLNESEKRFDAIITDRLMPGEDGLELVERIKNHAELENIPVVIQSSLCAKHDFEEGIKAGAYFYLTKPYQRRLLLAVVSSAIEDGRRKRALFEESSRWDRCLNLLYKGEYRFRTLNEANELAAMLGTLCSNKAMAAKGFSELLINAIEHGNLGIGYDEKRELLESGCWLEELDRRLNLPEQQNRYVVVKFRLSDDEVFQVSIRDEGQGFAYRRYFSFDPSRATDPHGRGIAMAKIAGFESVDYLGCGNQVVVTARVASFSLNA